MVVIYLKKFRKPALAVLLLLAISCAVLVIHNVNEKIINYDTKKADDTAEAFLTAICCFEREGKEIEIFDIEKGEVIKKLEMNDEVRTNVEAALSKITGMYIKVKAFPDKGYIARIPLEPAVEVHNEWPNKYGIYSVNEVFIIFAEGNAPYLLILDSNYRPLFFNFEQEDKLMFQSFL